MNPFSLADRAALVTGSSQGIGYAIANGLREAGARVVFHGLPAQMETDAHYISTDLMQPGAPAQLIAAAFAAEPLLDTLDRKRHV